MTKITTYNRGIIIDGHADTKEECETITLLCNSLAKDENFKQVAYDDGYAAFERIGHTEELRFMPATITIIITINGANVDGELSGGNATWENNAAQFQCSISGSNVVYSDGTILQYNGVDVLPTDNIRDGAEYTTRAASTTVTLEAGVYKISKTPNLINNSKAGTTEQITTDGSTVFIKDTVIQSGTEIECDSRGIQITWGGTDSSGASANGGFYIANATPNDYIWRISEASDGSSYQYRFANLTAPTDEQFDKVLTIILTSDVEISQSLYDWWEANTTKQSSKLSVDLTTLSGWSNLSSGSHTIKIVAKGSGYRDSEKSEGVSVTKAAVVTYDNVTLGKVDYHGQTQGTLVYNQIANADKTKYYIIVTGSDSNNLNYYGYLAWDNTKSMWSEHTTYVLDWNGYGCKIVADKSNETSIVFGFGDVGAHFSTWSDDAVCVSSATEPDSTTGYATIFSTYAKQSASYWTCFIEGTRITLADGTKKLVEDITYNDDILCWDFYKGELTSAKPAWITTVHIANCYNLCKFSNGAEVGFVGMGGTEGYHRIYNDEAKAFTHTGVPETPIGTTTFAEDGTFPKLVKQQIVKKDVKFYNIGTEKHFNLFTNSILASSRISNMYAIKDMKYYGERLISDNEINAYIEAKRNY